MLRVAAACMDGDCGATGRIFDVCLLPLVGPADFSFEGSVNAWLCAVDGAKQGAATTLMLACLHGVSTSAR
jgi:hypothetical protein